MTLPARPTIMIELRSSAIGGVGVTTFDVFCIDFMLRSSAIGGVGVTYNHSTSKSIKLRSSAIGGVGVTLLYFRCFQDLLRSSAIGGVGVTYTKITSTRFWLRSSAIGGVGVTYTLMGFILFALRSSAIGGVGVTKSWHLERFQFKPWLMIIFEDKYILIVEKPAGLLSVPGRGPDKADCLIVRVQNIHPEALIVHRLDMATSGLMVLARDHEMQRALSIAFAQRYVQKSYTALVQGVVAQDAGEIDLPLITDWPNRPRQKVDFEIGKPSLTRYQVRERAKDVTRIHLEPYTGRSHQLRVHMCEIGHPIVGDVFYGDGEGGRLMLHAQELAFEHPVTKVALRYVSSAPF